MWSGDSLTVLLFFFGTAIAAVLTAINSQPGWRANLGWGITAIAVVSGLTWLLAPAASPVIAAIRPWAVALVESNALAMVIIVGFVALIHGGSRRPTQGAAPGLPAAKRLPAFAVPPTTKWAPDITLSEAVSYLGAHSTWRYAYGHNDVKNTTEELTSALAANKITAWGREHPGEGELYEIRQVFWNRTEVTHKNDYVFSNRDQIGAYDVHFCRKEMEQVWPPKKRGASA